MAAQSSSPLTAAAVPASAPAPRAGLADWRVQMALVMLVALLLRLVYLLQTQRWPFFYVPVLDASSQYEWAQHLLQTPLWMGSGRELAKPPLYTYFLAVNIWLFGVGKASLFGAHLVQLLLGAFTSGLVYLIGRRTFGTGAGLIAGLMYALYSQGLFNEGELLDSALATCLAAAFLLSLLAALDAPTTGRWFGAGVLLGLLGLARGNLLLLCPVALVLLLRWLRREREGEEVRNMAIALVGGIALMVLPITARNAVIDGEFVPISTNGGINLYTGNNPDSDGYSPIPAGYAWEQSWYQWMPQGPMSLMKQDRFWRNRALGFWVQQPGKALALTVKKAYLYWNAYDIPNNLSYDWGRSHASLLRATLPFAVLGPLGLLGLLMGWRRDRASRTAALFVLSIMAATMLFFVAGRYRMAMMPALLPFAGLAVMDIARGVSARRWRPLAAVLLGLVLCAAFINSDVYRVHRARGANRDDFLLGQSCMKQGNPRLAAEAFHQGTVRHPDDPDAWAAAGEAERFLGNSQAAAESYRGALRAAPGFARAAAMLAELSMAQGWPLQEPRALLERALKQQFRSPEALFALTEIDLRLQDKARVAADLEKLAPVIGGQASWGPQYEQYRSKTAALVQAAVAMGVPVPESLAPAPQPQSLGGPQFE